MKLLLGCDHAGFTLKAFLKDEMEAQGYTIVDGGCTSETDKVDYPNISAQIAAVRSIRLKGRLIKSRSASKEFK